jgi:hypothetical protein
MLRHFLGWKMQSPVVVVVDLIPLVELVLLSSLFLFVKLVLVVEIGQQHFRNIQC